MEFKEFKNPLQVDYDIKSGIKNVTTKKQIPDNSLNLDQGVDLNSLGDLYNQNFSDSNNNIEVNEFGEIIRVETTGRSR